MSNIFDDMVLDDHEEIREETWLSSLVEQNSRLVDKMNQLVEKNNKLVEQNNQLVGYIQDQLVENAEHYDTLKESLDVLAEANASAVNSMSNIINDNVNQIAYKVYTKSELHTENAHKKGKEHMAYKNLPINEIKDLYEKGDTPEKIADIYGVSAYTIRVRLKSLGIYRDGRLKK